jgi:hypothetical protein
LVRLGEHGEGHGRHGDERDADGLKREEEEEGIFWLFFSVPSSLRAVFGHDSRRHTHLCAII